MKFTRHHLALLSPLPLVCAVLAVSCAKMMQREDLVTVESVSPSSHACGHCHVEIYEEWAASAHAEAFTDEAFQAATLGGRTESCLGCHAPKSVLHMEGTPVVRESLREEGVACISCHLDEHSMALVGPLTDMGPVVPHAVIEGDEWFRSSALCGGCHAAAMEQVEEWAPIVDDTRTCQECHMAPKTRHTTQATDLISAGIVALHDEHETRSHTFHLGAMADFPGAVDFSVSTNGTHLLLSAVNNLPHAIPTGEFGQRPVTLRFVAMDANGAVVATAHRDFTRHEGDAMIPHEPVTLSIDRPFEAVRLVATLERMGETATELAVSTFVIENEAIMREDPS